MPAKNYLTQAQKENLQKALKESNSHHFSEKVLILLLMNDGKTYHEISEFLGCSYRSVAYWCVHGDPDKLESLRDGREKGNAAVSNSCLYSTVNGDDRNRSI